MPKQKTSVATLPSGNSKGSSTPATPKPRRLKAPKYRSFSLQQHIRPAKSKLASGWSIFRRAVGLLFAHWKLFLGIVAVYGLLNALFVQSFGGADQITSVKQLLDEAFTSGFEQVISSTALFIYLISASGNISSSTASAYQMILTIVVSLALVWALREAFAGNRARIRDAFYKGMYPLVPFLLVLLIIVAQFVPLLIGLYLYNIATTQGVAATTIENWLWGVFVFFSAVLSLYFVSSSIFALYIVCLPDMTPLRAIRSAKQLVEYRRLTVMRKILFLPVILFMLSALIMVPIILFVTPLAPWVFFILSMAILPLVHGYMYSLYRELL